MRRLVPLAVGAVVVLVVVLAAAVVGSPRMPDDAPRLGVTLSTDDRRTLAAPPVLRGPDVAVDPVVDLTDPEAIAHAYLRAAHGAVPEDAGRTNRRGAGYAVPGSAAATVGVLVLDPPVPGTERTASVRALELVAADPGDGRRAYLAAVETSTGPPHGPYEIGLVTGHIVLAHQADGRWLVAADTAENPDLT